MSEPNLSANSTTPSQRYGLRAIFVKHDSLFTVIGALIIFFGFLLREEVEGPSKSLDAYLHEARDTSAVYERLATLHRGIDDVKDTTTRDTDFGVSKEDQDKIRHDFSQASDELQYDKQAYDLDSRLISQLDVSPPVPLFHEEDANKQLERLTNTANDLKESIKELADDDPHERAREIAEVDRFKKEEGHLMLDVAGYSGSVFGQAKIKQKDLRKRLNRAKNGSTLLFFMGWSLGLVGKIVKIPAAGTVEDSK